VDYAKAYQALSKWYGLVPYHLAGGYALPPLHVFIEVTYRCNLSCRMCQYYSYMKDSKNRESQPDDLTFDEIKGVINSVPWYTLFTFTGGELFFRKDMMDILEWAARRRISIVTNGTLLDEGRIQRLVELAPKSPLGNGLLLVDVSLEGTEETHDDITGVKGSFARTVRTLRLLSEARKKKGGKYPVLNMKTVITKHNLEDLGYLYGLASELELDMFNPMIKSDIDVHTHRLSSKEEGDLKRATVVKEGLDTAMLTAQLKGIMVRHGKQGSPQIRFTPPDIPIEEVARYYDRTMDINNYACYSPWSRAAISAYGDVTFCPFFSLGNIRRKSFREIWNGAEMVRMRRALKKDNIYPGCMGCCNMTYTGTGRSR